MIGALLCASFEHDVEFKRIENYAVHCYFYTKPIHQNHYNLDVLYFYAYLYPYIQTNAIRISIN